MDPLADAFTFLNPFNYADNNPTTMIDLYGLQAIKAGGGAAIQGAGSGTATGAGFSLFSLFGGVVNSFKKNNPITVVAGAPIHLSYTATVPKGTGSINIYKESVYDQIQNSLSLQGTDLLFPLNAASKVTASGALSAINDAWVVATSGRPGYGARDLAGHGQNSTQVQQSASRVATALMARFAAPLLQAAKAAKGGVQAEKVSGSYLLEFQSGRFYVGKGLEPRMMQSIKRIEASGDLLKPGGAKFFPASGTREAFINEYNMMKNIGLPTKYDPNSLLYNKIWSPGKKLLGQ